MTTEISTNLLEWYDRHARVLPWRVPPAESKAGVLPDPYHVWLSEIMLQQTQVATVREYYRKFLVLWPNVHQLALADQEDVMKAWAGLGYYSRARNLKKCAEIVFSDYQGEFPQHQSELQDLPGIGQYTSAAISAIAFHQAVPVVDGNVERVFSRLFQMDTPLPKAKAEIHALVQTHLHHHRPGDFAQACMDLGATVCLPKTPNCLLCPLSKKCRSNIAGNPIDYPVRLPKKIKPLRKGAAYVAIDNKGAILLCKRPESGLLAGMTSVPTTDWNSNKDGSLGKKSAPFPAKWKMHGRIKHTFTHFHLELEVWQARITFSPDFEGWWSSIDEIPLEALPSVIKKVLELASPGSTGMKQS